MPKPRTQDTPLTLSQTQQSTQEMDLPKTLPDKLQLRVICMEPLQWSNSLGEITTQILKVSPWENWVKQLQ